VLSSLLPSFSESVAYVTALGTMWAEVSYAEGLKSAESLAKQMLEAYNTVVQEVVVNPPLVTN